MRYQVEYGAHPDVAIVHLALPSRISSRTYSFTASDADQATGTFAPVIKQLLNVQGVSEVFICDYHISIHKSPAFAWDVPLWDTLQVLRQTFGTLEEIAEPRQQPPDPDCPTKHTPSSAVKH